MKKILCALFFIAITFVSTFLFSVTNVFAATTEDVESKIISFTDNDTFTYNSTTYSIQDYKNSINNNSLFGSTMDLGISYYYAYSDDPIVNIIPKELFCTVGVETYIGREYGFFIKTVSETYYDGDFSRTSNNYRSYVIVFDITNNTDLVTNVDRAIFTVTNLFSLEYITISEEESYLWRKDDAMYTEYLNDNYDYYFSNNIYYEYSDSYCVLPLYDLNDNAKTNRYYLNDISFGAHLQNEQAYNANDDAYVGQNDIGSYFTRLDYIYDGKYIVEGSWADVDYGALLNIAIETGLSYIPYIGDALSDIYSTVSTGIEVIEILDEGLSDKEYDSTNDSYITQAYYVNRDDQLQHYGYLTKCAYFAFNTNSDMAILYEENDYARLEYTIGHSALGEEPNLTRMTNEIALKIVDRDFNLVSCATSSNEFSLRDPIYKELNLGNNNKAYLLSNGVNYFCFTPVYSGKYVLNINCQSKLKVTFDEITQQGTALNIEKAMTKGIKYILKIENMSSIRRCISFDFDVSTNTNNISVNSNNNYIVKVDSINGFKKVSFNNNGNLSILSEDLILIKSSNTSNIHYLFSDDCYILIKNNTSSSINGNLNFTNDFSIIYSEENYTMQLSNEENFYKFVPTTSGKYSFIVFDPSNENYDFVVYSDTKKSGATTIFGSNFIKYDYNLIGGNTYYIGYENCNLNQGIINFAVKSNTNVFDFYVDGELVEGEIYMTQGQVFDLVVKVNDILLENVCIYAAAEDKYSYIKRQNDGKYKLDDNAPTTDAFSHKLSVIDTDAIELESMIIRALPNFSIKLENDAKEVYENNALDEIKLDANKISWEFISSNSLNKANVILKFTFGDNTYKLCEYTIVGIKGKFDLPPFDEILTSYGKYKAIATVEIVEVEFLHNWNGEIYPTTFTNSYPSAPILSEYQFTFAPVSINLMFNSGSGTSSDPFIIVNEWQLNNIRLCDSEYRENGESFRYIQSYFAIKYDINMENEWQPIDTPIKGGKIYGYENQRKTIYNLEISESKGNLNIGFVRCLYGGSIEYLNFYEAKINVANSSNKTLVSIGIIVGSASGGSIRNCSALTGSEVNVGTINDSKTITGAKFTYTGGICGYGSTIYNCTNGATISSYGDVGGIVGYSIGATITSSTNSGNVVLMHNNVDLSSDDENKAAGGIIGIAYGVTFIDVENKGTIEYQSKEKCTDKNLAPRMGSIAGEVLNSSMDGDEITSKGVAYNKFTIDNLQTKNGFLGIGKYDQTKYTGYQYGIVE